MVIERTFCQFCKRDLEHGGASKISFDLFEKGDEEVDGLMGVLHHLILGQVNCPALSPSVARLFDKSNGTKDSSRIMFVMLISIGFLVLCYLSLVNGIGFLSCGVG